MATPTMKDAFHRADTLERVVKEAFAIPRPLEDPLEAYLVSANEDEMEI